MGKATLNPLSPGVCSQLSCVLLGQRGVSSSLHLLQAQPGTCAWWLWAPLEWKEGEAPCYQALP